MSFVRKNVFVLCVVIAIGLYASTHLSKQIDPNVLIHAAEKGDLNKVKSLVDKGYNIDFITSRGITALDAALMNGHSDVAKYLI